MKRTVWARLQHQVRLGTRSALAALPTPVRFATYRNLIDCDPVLDDAFKLKIASTQDELEACFALLHDAYVASGFMRPHPSGLRVTPYHALPTTTTLCAKMGDKVVGTLSIVREGVFGFPMQSAFDIGSVRARSGRIAEISALAVHPAYRKTGGAILFPLMKFMYEYCTRYFDTRHLVIAVNPRHIEMYESLLFFRRLTAQVVDRYDFVNGAPAVGATLDLQQAPQLFERAYGHKAPKRNLHRYFVELRLPQIDFPSRPWHLSNDPVMTPALVDHFFNRRTRGFETLDDRRKALLRSIYAGPDWAAVLPPLNSPADAGAALRRHPRYTLQCPAALQPSDAPAQPHRPITIVEISAQGFQARVAQSLKVGDRFSVAAELAQGISARVSAEVVRLAGGEGGELFGFRVDEPDPAWQRCVAWLEAV
ncbi:MAG: GNAT family N-acetyltransferase [Burkholderiales bacterium]|nr:GNAT family N-acetyltransferase [Burkholderiales bacterium]